MAFLKLLKEIKSCTYCADYLLVAPKPVVQLHESAKLLIIAQAPGVRASSSEKPFDDASGDRLRDWLGIDRKTFYDAQKIACMPMGFCYPGTKVGGDLPPCAECAPLWHHRVLPYLKNVELILVVGSFAHQYYLNTFSNAETFDDWRKFLPLFIPLPHPSWHNNNWLMHNQWFLKELVPELRRRVEEILRPSPS